MSSKWNKSPEGKEYARNYQLQNKERCHKISQKSYLKHRKEKLEYGKMYKDNNRKAIWAWATIRAHRLRGHDVRITPKELIKVASDTCAICGVSLDYGKKINRGKSVSNSPSVDRVNNEGVLTVDNIQIVCRECNATKRGRTMEEFIMYCRTISDKFGA